MIMPLIQKKPRFLLMLLGVLSLAGALPITVRADTVLRLGGTGCGLGPMKLLQFADFIFTEQGRGILKTTGNLPLGPGRDR